MSAYIDAMSGELHPDAQPIVIDGNEVVTAVCDCDSPPEPGIQQLAREEAAQALRRIFEIVRGHHALGDGVEQFVGRRFLCMVWLVNPTLLSGDGKAISLREFARRMGRTAPNYSIETAEFSRLLGIKNEFANHAWNRRTEAETPLAPDEPGDDDNEGELHDAK